MKLLIVDDEPKILNGLIKNMNWFSLGIMEVLNAENGLEALKIFQKQLPEIVITDVRMPGLDGIQLCKRIRAICADTRIVILSGYADFDYVKDALKLDISDYELKPVKFSRLQETVRKQILEIEKRKNKLNEEIKWIELSRENFMAQVLSKKLEQHYIYSGMKQHFDFSPTGKLILLKIDIDQYYRLSASEAWDRSAGESIEFFNQRIKAAFEPSEYIFYGKKVNHMVAVIQLEGGTNSVNTAISKLRKLHAEINEELEKRYGFSVSFGVSSAGELEEISKMFAEASLINTYRFYYGSKAFMAYDGENTRKKNEYLIELDENTILGSIENLNLTLVFAEITKVFEELKNLKCNDVDCIRFYYFSFRNLLMQKVNDMGKSYQALCCEEDAQNQVLPFFDTIDEYKNNLMELFRTIISKISDNGINVCNPTISKAIDYICMNYSNPNISIDLLAGITQKNPDYFSHIFRKEIGISFTGYMNNIRVEKAKKLLKESNYLVYEISVLVGFNDFKYFTQVFKKSTGFSPSDYRKLA